MRNWNSAERPTRLLIGAALMALSTWPLPAASPTAPAVVTTPAKETRNRANVLLIGDLFSAAVAERLQSRWNDEASIFLPTQPAGELATVVAALKGWLAARAWHVVILSPVPAAAFRRGVRGSSRATDAVAAGTRGGANLGQPASGG